jgi:hypothetical protein
MSGITILPGRRIVMNTTKHVVCVFPHGEGEFKSTDELLEFLNVTLPGERQGRYYLRDLGRTKKFEGKSFREAVIKGSLTLFRMQGKVWGTAFVKHGIEDILDYDPYRFTIDFYPEAIMSYDRGIAVQDIQRVTGRELTAGWLRASYLVLGYSDIIEQRLMEVMDLPLRP